jgi:predicted transcriptional regulator
MSKILDKVRKLVEEGHGRVIVARELGLSAAKATQLVAQVRSEGNFPPANLSPVKKKANGNRRNTKKIRLPKSGNTREKIASLANRGFGARKISQALGITESKVDHVIADHRAEPKKIKRIDQVNEALSSGKSVYELAKELHTTPQGLKTMLAKAKGEYDPMGKWIKDNCMSGVRFSELEEELELNGELEAAVAILEEELPGYFIVVSEIDNDFFLLPVLDSSGEHEWLGEKRITKFKYFVNEDENYMTIRFDEDLPGDKIHITNITDIHVGAKAFRLSTLQEQIERIKNDDMAFFTIGGDLIEAITKLSIADPMEQYCNINTQVVEAVKLFMPIAHKCLAIEFGNHCGGRTEKVAQFDLARTMAQMLKVPYFRVRVTIDLYWRGVNKTISLAHNYGNALRMPQIIAKVKGILGQMTTPIHCWFSGHTHDSFVIPVETTIKIPGKGLQVMTYFIANGGSFMKYTGTYAEKADYGRTPQDIVYFTFDDQGNHSAGSFPLESM